MNILKKLRTERGYNQQKLSELLCVSRSTIAMWETDKAEPNRELLLKLADIFEVSIDYLLGKTDFSAEENRNICQNITRLLEEIKNPPNLDNIIGITQSFSQIQKNEYQFTNAVLEQFASYFGVDIDDLLASPSPTPEKEASDIDIMIATESKDLSDKDKQEILHLIQYKKRQTEVPTSPFESSRAHTTIHFDDDTERIAAFGGMEDTDDEPLMT